MRPLLLAVLLVCAGCTPPVGHPGSADGGQYYCQHHACPAPTVGTAGLYVGKLNAPQERALADQTIEHCDAIADARKAAQGERTLRQAQQAWRERANTETLSHEIAQCNQVGGLYRGGLCNSTVSGNPSGRPGADCSWAHPIYINGNIEPNLSLVLGSYPGCFKPLPH
jgi:hypothetical protein